MAIPPTVTDPPAGTTLEGFVAGGGMTGMRTVDIIKKPSDISTHHKHASPVRHATTMLITPIAVTMPGRPLCSGTEYSSGESGIGGGIGNSAPGMKDMLTSRQRGVKNIGMRSS
jgi:hypothetical protein